jgi:hypothetical protein
VNGGLNGIQTLPLSVKTTRYPASELGGAATDNSKSSLPTFLALASQAEYLADTKSRNWVASWFKSSGLFI